jgi:hypothetical protein
MSNFPDYEPTTVREGEYLAEIKTGVSEKPSQYNPGATFRVMELILQNSVGEYTIFTWAFSPKSPVYRTLLMILGGTELPSGRITPPSSMIGRKFMAKIIERPAKNDKSRMVNEIIRVMPYEEVKRKVEKQPVKKAASFPEPELEPEEPLGGEEADEDIPF